ncbi:uncharacterized protein [Clytia hemisphaerica]|uniref:uncharacterized protein isoform X1 n=1 Tax=Clytia hemisphaerica TaxID=252671 RepID=UPI0034D4C54D
MRLFLLPIFCAAFAFSDAKWLSHYDTKNPCLDLADGSYPLADLFAYIKCVRDEATYLKCKDNKIFDPESQKCVHGNHLSAKTFCKNREDGNYQNPWDCNRFVQCVHKKAHIISCQADGLVYDPYLDMCRDNLRCQKISLRSPIEDGDACKYLTDGNYAIRDVFKYLQCKDNKGTFVPCEEKNTIFDPEAGKCIDIKTKTPETFCQGRTNDDWVNPWDCHGFFKCWYNTTHQFKCQLPELVFNPYTDQCNYKEKYACKQVEQQGKTKTREVNLAQGVFCDEKKDGVYAIRDVFKYIQCSNGVSSVLACPENEIFAPKYGKCVSGKYFAVSNFCDGRTDGNWMNPWTCHRFISCTNELPLNKPCILNSMVYDPYKDECVSEKDYPCKSIKVSLTIRTEDACKYMINGRYALRDVFKYLDCQEMVGNVIDCPHNFIYDPDPNVEKCVDIKTKSYKNFCINRENDDWADPWNCQKFIQCFWNHLRNQTCIFPTWTGHFDPYHDWCAYQRDYKCIQVDSVSTENGLGKIVHSKIKEKISSYIQINLKKNQNKISEESNSYQTSKPEDACLTMVNDLYPLRDVFKYLKCEDQVGTVIPCSKNYIFDPNIKKCVDIKTQYVKTFCANRGLDDWANPWDCHTYISCAENHTTNVMACQDSSFHYDPYHDYCDYPGRYPCIQVTGVDNVNMEPNNDDDSEMSNPKSFGVHENKLDWVQVVDRFESPDKTLMLSTGNNIDEQEPLQDTKCSDPYCNWLGWSPIEIQGNTSQVADTDLNFCKDKSDGKYAIRDVFKYIQCTNKVPQLMCCPNDMLFVELYKSCKDTKHSGGYVNGFCKNRANGNYMNPWYCRRYMVCTDGVNVNTPCTVNGMVYNPCLDHCVPKDKYPCVYIKSGELDCTQRMDGNYAIRDLFSYLRCSFQQSFVIECPAGFIYENVNSKCVPNDDMSPERVCIVAADGNFRDPWDCNGYIQCKHQQAYMRKCTYLNMVYNPHNDLCEFVSESEEECTQYPQKNEYMVFAKANDTICQDKAQFFNYVFYTPSPFQYMVCSDGHASLVTCDTNQIFIPGRRCVDGAQYNIDNFCKDRVNISGIYGCESWFLNPWNCSECLFCQSDVKVHHSPTPAKGFYYDPVDQKFDTHDCKELPSSKEVSSDDDACKGKADGNYPLHDVLSYLSCKKGKSTPKNCPTGSIFYPSSKECDSITKTTLTSFCKGRSDGDWQNPWNCNGYILCQSGRSIVRPCLINGFVFNPYNDVCVRSNKYPCYTVGARSGPTPKVPAILKSSLPQIKDICSNLTNGNYSTRDVLSFLQCTNGTSKMIACPKDTIYVSGNNCTAAKNINEDNFCTGRPEGNYRNPWDCHTYYVCHSGQRIHKQVCNIIVTLNYDPKYDTCEYPAQMPCKQLGKSMDPSHNVGDNKCKGKTDGTYPLRDVFSYLVCKKGKASIVNCPKGSIFFPSTKECESITKTSLPSFCQGRSDGDWQNPWNCHGYVLCQSGRSLARPCLINGFVFDPYNDVCKRSFPCQTVYSKSIMPSKLPHEVSELTVVPEKLQIKDICTGLKDGNYSTRETLKIFQCKNGTSSWIACPKDTIYVSGNNCTNSSTINEDNFCKERPEGNYRNPWDCHTYYVCHSGQRIHKQVCNYFVTLNYDPIFDNCESPLAIACPKSPKQNKLVQHKPVKDDNPCAKRVDGKYAVRDVALYLICKDHKASEGSCDKGQIFTPSNSKCVPIGQVNIKNFCVGREMGNYRNPWNCHSYITCVGPSAFERPCSIKTTLNYSPKDDLCEYPYKQKCVNITTYQCTVPVSQRIDCGYCGITQGQCEAKRYCWRPLHPGSTGPWCYHSKNNFTIFRASSLVEHELKAYGPCAELPDGNYAVRDVAKYLICKNKVDSEGKCAKGQIFTPSTSKCVPIGKVDKEKFCVGREAGNYRDPWNCHNYFTCVGHISYNRPCSVKTTLNYSPLDDLCEFPSQYKCENITSVAPSPIKDENPCDGKADGVYEIRDVFRFLRCRKGKASLRNCKDGRYFSPVAGRCIRGKKVDLTTFCKGRGESNFRNPWDCHNYITCHGAQSFDRECDVHVELNYDPYHDRCEKPALFPCKELNPKDIMAEIIEAELIVF